MALTVKMLQAMDISQDKIDQIIEAHRASVNGLTELRDQYKADLDKYKTDAEKLASVEKELEKANAKIEAFAETENKLKEIQTEFDTYKAETEKKEVQIIKEKAYKDLLREVGISEKRFDAIVRVTDLTDVVVGDDGKIKDSKELVDSIKSEWADFIVKRTEQGANTPNPPANTGGGTFDKMSLAEKMAYANDNPDNAEVQAWLK